MNEMYIIEKKGYYYRPDSMGYTAFKREAGRYSFEDAAERVGPNGPDGSQDGMSMWLETEAPNYAPECNVSYKLREENRLLKEEMQTMKAASSREMPESQPADIYSKPGTKIRFICEGGYETEKQNAKNILVVGQLYTLKKSNISSFSTQFILEEFPEHGFNSCLFNGVQDDES